MNRQISNDEKKSNIKNSPPVTLSRRPTFSSTLSGSVTSLNSLSSRSRASSIQDGPLSTSSSSASLSSSSPSQNQPIPVVTERSSVKNTAAFVDRRKSVGGKIKPFIPDFNNDNERRSKKVSNGNNSSLLKRSTNSSVAVQKRKSLQLTLISPNQIQQTAKLGRLKQNN